jgi:short-subunit dehydrogenase
VTFAGRGFIITGAASGIGLSTARMLKQQGARLVLWDANKEVLQAVAKELDVSCSVVDVTQTEQVIAAMDSAVDQLGRVDGVIHCAGILRNGLFEQVDLAKHIHTIKVNLIGSIIVTHAALPYLKHSRGSLILMCSIAAFYGPPEYASYGASKAGVLSFAQALRIETAQQAIHIGVVSPHSVDTPMLDAENRKSRFVRRFGTPHTADDVALAILRGLERRQFMIFPGMQPRLIFWLTKLLSPALSFRVMRAMWR